jgi:hypothetical protein
MGLRPPGLTPPPGESWRCPECGKRFARREQRHSCGVVSLAHHFRGRPRSRALFEAFRAAVEDAAGPARLSVAKTRIGFLARITFAAVTPRREYLRAGFLLPRRSDSPRFVQVEHIPPYWVHTLRIRHESDIDPELRAWLREAAAVGSRR